jgi:hypothetical protein
VLPIEMRNGENADAGELVVQDLMKLVVSSAAARTFAPIKHTKNAVRVSLRVKAKGRYTPEPIQKTENRKQKGEKKLTVDSLQWAERLRT